MDKLKAHTLVEVLIAVTIAAISFYFIVQIFLNIQIDLSVNDRLKIGLYYRTLFDSLVEVSLQGNEISWMQDGHHIVFSKTQRDTLDLFLNELMVTDSSTSVVHYQIKVLSNE